ncbi:translation factor [Ascodesmis nigricans]|uniref:Threonylcarbamoyl-AMP synthase n=1 Tax=Ascodesmis nigricans TaxID=341454 RepID=A0A4S2N4S1_9PEZI|nr:translation factor [Ascodesmis nigricans]
MATDTRPPSGPPSTPPPQYRKRLETEVRSVDPSAVAFTPSSTSPDVHPYDSPTLSISSEETFAALHHAAALLLAQQPIAFPTETVYGLGADATSDEAVASIFTAKSRPSDNPLIVHIASLQQLRALLPENKIPEFYLPLIHKFWPGALTILLPLPSPPSLSKRVTATQPTFGARMPNHTIPLALSAMTGKPLAAPSANESGKPSPTAASHVFTDLQGRIPLILDAGGCSVGVESTVIDGFHSPPIILRPGGVSVEAIRACGGIWASTIVAGESYDDNSTISSTRKNSKSSSATSTADVDSSGPRAPGMKYKHYSPRAGVILYEHGARPPAGRALIDPRLQRIGVIRTRTWKPGSVEREVRAEEEIARRDGGELSPTEIFEVAIGESGEDIARGLFAAMREVDEKDVDVIHVEGIEEKEEGKAVMNRLYKAASVVVRNVSAS